MARLARFLVRLRRLWRRMTWRDWWDALMVYLAFLNLGLIVFDLTYLWLRPTYQRLAPAVTRLYDPLKGIEPHRLTESYLADVERLEEALAAGAPDERLAPILAELRTASLAMLEENPFERSGQERQLVRTVVRMRAYLKQQEAGRHPEEIPSPEVFERFWSPPGEEALLAARLRWFEVNVSPLLAANYYRRYDLDGDFVDHFWWLDLPFLALFTVEFYGRWILAVRRRTYAAWWLFPLLNWYDLLGIIPIREFRLFRLFRIASIYVRLHKSTRTRVGDDLVSRTVKYFANIISEEISDMVSLRILNETQAEILDGTHRRIIRRVAARHREALARQLTLRTAQVLASPRVRQQARELLDANLAQAVESAEALRRLRLPRRLMQPLIEAVGQAVFDSIADTLAATLESAEGQEALAALYADAVDAVAVELTEGELEGLVTEITVEILDDVKQAVAVRKWAALPSQTDTP